MERAANTFSDHGPYALGRSASSNPPLTLISCAHMSNSMQCSSSKGQQWSSRWIHTPKPSYCILSRELTSIWPPSSQQLSGFLRRSLRSLGILLLAQGTRAATFLTPSCLALLAAPLALIAVLLALLEAWLALIAVLLLALSKAWLALVVCSVRVHAFNISFNFYVIVREPSHRHCHIKETVYDIIVDQSCNQFIILLIYLINKLNFIAINPFRTAQRMLDKRSQIHRILSNLKNTYLKQLELE